MGGPGPHDAGEWERYRPASHRHGLTQPTPEQHAPRCEPGAGTTDTTVSI